MIRIETLEKIEEAVFQEIQNCKTYGELYNTDHEFYGVFLEEVEELEAEFNLLKSTSGTLWNNIKANEDIKDNLKDLSINIRRLLCEGCQVAAVIDKCLDGKKD